MASTIASAAARHAVAATYQRMHGCGVPIDARMRPTIHASTMPAAASSMSAAAT